MGATSSAQTIEQGAKYVATVTVTDTDSGAAFDLSTYTADMQLRVDPLDDVPIATCTIAPSPLDTTGIFTCTLTSAVTHNLEPKKYYYDLKITDANNDPIYIITGFFTVTQTFSR